jgi:class 3 adenylate cyclase
MAMSEIPSRRLAAILAADIAGYSALVGVDEARTVRDLKEHQAAVLPMVVDHGGRVIDTAGDGFLADFGSAVNAVECAIAVQERMVERNRAVDAERRMQFRMGINIGDIICDQARIYGDGINIAARLQSIAEPGGIVVSRQAQEQVEGRVAIDFRAMGLQTLKNIARPIETYAIVTSGYASSTSAPRPPAAKQQINYCRTPGGVRLAWAKVGQGPPLVRTANWLTHLEYDWSNPVRRYIIEQLARHHTLIRYDARGNGLSDWDVDELSLDAWVRDLETVVEAANGSASSAGTRPVGDAAGGFARGGYRRSPEEREQRKAMATLMRLGWGAPMSPRSVSCSPRA